MKDWLKRINEYTHDILLRELKITEPTAFQNFLRLDGTLYEECLFTLEIEKRNTSMRDAIPPS